MAASYPVPSWLRRAATNRKSLLDQGFEDIAMAAGAAIGALDSLTRADHKWAGAWRLRLALAAAAVTAKQEGRIEDEAALRDALLLTGPDDDAGPAGHLLLAWRQLATRPAKELVTAANLAAVLEMFGHHPGDAPGELADTLQELISSEGTISALAGALTIAGHHGFGLPFGAWLADALLARRLGWTYALPLLGTEPSFSKRMVLRRSSTGSAHPAENGLDTEWVRNLLAAQARAALRAIDLAAELDRRAEKLLAVAPKLRAKGAATVVKRLLSDDAIVASQHSPGMSDRGLRRLFDRLVSLGAVRELTGRTTFRIYGL
jgi:hypothetical protein